MRWKSLLKVWITIHVVAFACGCDHFKNFGNKRLNGADIVATKTFSSQARCIQACYHGNHGCLAVNVISTNDVITCEMMRCLNKESEMVDDPSSTLFVKNYLHCEIYQNGASCVPNKTSGKCYCAEGYYGNRCEFQYIRRDDMDCLVGNDLFTLRTHKASDYDNCKQWCTDNSDCGGFVAAWWNKCYFKANICMGHLVQNSGVKLYLKQLK